MSNSTIDIDANPNVPNEDPPQRGQRHQLQRDSDGEVADKTVLGCLHTPTGIKMRATEMAARKLFPINGLRFWQGPGCQPMGRAVLPGWQHTAKMAGKAGCSVAEVLSRPG